MEITIDLRMYPAFLELTDPKQTILSILDTQHIIFQSQRSAIPTTHLSEMMDILQRSSCKTTLAIQETIQKMKVTDERLRHSVTDIQSSGEIVRSNLSELRGVGSSMLSSVSEFKILQETLKELPVLLSKSQTKGHLGEICVSDFLRETLTPADFVIESTSTQSHSGDMRVSRRDFECIVESKFYKQTVPKKEVEKLKRDMSERKVRCGVMLSLTSGVAGFKSIDMDVYTDENDTVACILILSHSKENPERILVGLKTLELIWEFFLKKNTVSSSSFAIREKSITILQNIMESSEDLRDLVKQYEKHKKSVFDSLSSFHDQLVKTIEKHTARVQEKLNAFI
jgi:hypothetical protein